MNQDNVLSQLARQLAINHYNISIAKQSRQGNDINNEEFTPDIKMILNNDIKSDELEFSRNILIVGAGASKNAYSFFQITSDVIKKIQGILNFSVFSEHEQLQKKYLEEASKIKGYVFSRGDFDNIPSNLGFEGYLKLLSNFFTEEDISLALKTAIRSQKSKDDISDYLPSLFYEVVAHLFRHRYIDIIINLNFDEMLDNAIEDDLGYSTYHRIISDLDCKAFEEIVDDNRLRIPIYIKPHGSFRSRSSMRFTKEHYIVLPNEIKDILSKIFEGQTGHNETKIKRFNIIFAGYGFFDIDIQKILFEQLQKSLIDDSQIFKNNSDIVINYYIFDYDKEYKSKFIGKFLSWLQVQNKVVDFDFSFKEKIANKISEIFYFIHCDSDYSLSEYDKKETVGLGFLFKKIYAEIQDNFKINRKETPFTPKSLTHQLLISLFFPRNILDGKISGANAIDPIDYFQKRARFECLYAFIKYGGKIPINVLNTDRAGKYFNKYLQSVKKTGKYIHQKEDSLLGFLESIAEAKNHRIEMDKLYISCTPFSLWSPIINGKIDGLFDDTINFIIDNMFLNSFASRTQQLFEAVKTLLIDDVYDTKTNEINAIYDDPKHRRFYPFKQESVINTNLELTWKFFNYVTKGTWDTLCMIDDSGKSILNLHTYSSDKQSHLANIANKKEKTIILLHTNKRPIKYVLRTLGKTDIIKQIESVYKMNYNGRIYNRKRFIAYAIDEEKSPHKMALFLKDNKAVFGIYYFKPGTKIKINPVCFDVSDAKNQSENDYLRKNLENMKILFKNSIPDDLLENEPQISDIFNNFKNKHDGFLFNDVFPFFAD